MSTITDPGPSGELALSMDRAGEPAMSAKEARRYEKFMQREGRREHGFSLSALWLWIPAGLFLAVFTVYPLIKMFILSFQDIGKDNFFRIFTLHTEQAHWVGFKNYTDVLSDKYFWTVLLRSMVVAAICVVLTMVIGMCVALLMNRLNKVVKTIVAVALLLAWAMPALTSTVIWKWMFDTQYGLVNWLLVKLGFEKFDNFMWLSKTVPFFFVLCIVITWGAVPFVAFSLFAGLTQVSDEVQEAGKLDGANAWERFRYIIVPFLKPVIAITLMLQVIWDMRVFTQVYALQSGSYDATNTIGVYIYRMGVGSGNYSAGSAIAVILTLIMLAIAVAYLRQLMTSEDV